MNILCLSIDGLHGGMLGPYGNAWISTPAFNRLACRSALFDRYYLGSTRLIEELGALWNCLKAAPNDFRRTLLSDDAEVFSFPGVEIFEHRQRLDFSPETVPAETLEETRFFKVFASLVDLLTDPEATEDGKPFFCWAHLAAFRGLWDFPLEYREIHRDDEDPEPYGGVTPPQILCGPGEIIDPDDLQSVMEAYSGGVSVLDAALAGLLDSLEETGLDRETLIVLFSTRGFSLGEHGLIGCDASLFSENVHLPLLVRFPDGDTASFRTPALVQSGDLGVFLAESLAERLAETDAAPGLLSQLIREETNTGHEAILLRGDENRRALVTPQWLLRERAAEAENAAELYVKPDDRWDVNDVADRCPDVVRELYAGLRETPGG